MKTAIGYTRVSTKKQGHSGLGLEAQREAVARCLNYGGWVLAGEFEEVESGRKGAKNRPQLVAAIAACKQQKSTLIIAKIDRLARDVRYFLEVLDDSRIDIRFAEFADIDPKTDEGRMLLINMANFAEFEARRIAARTKSGLAVAKAKGKVLGFKSHKDGGASFAQSRGIGAKQLQDAADVYANSMKPTIHPMRQQGLSYAAIAERLDSCKVPTQKGGKWSITSVKRICDRFAQ